jgi:puromycin-sensitive aminopeptidase
VHDASAATGEAAYRLPRTVLPRRYELRIEPDLGKATFVGTAEVAVEVQEPVREVVLNASELEVGETWLVGDDGARVDATATLDQDRERLTLALAEEVAAGAWTVHIAYRGVINDKLKGFYRSTFVDAEA